MSPYKALFGFEPNRARCVAAVDTVPPPLPSVEEDSGECTGSIRQGEEGEINSGHCMEVSVLNLTSIQDKTHYEQSSSEQIITDTTVSGSAPSQTGLLPHSNSRVRWIYLWELQGI